MGEKGETILTIVTDIDQPLVYHSNQNEQNHHHHHQND